MSLLEKLARDGMASRIWRRDLSVFAPASAPSATRDAIAQRLGWLDAPQKMTAELPALRALAERGAQDGITSAFLLGMGGSSLCAEVLRESAPRGPRGVALTVLDTTDELAINNAAGALDPARTLFLTASKSGTTVEVSSLEAYFRSIVARSVTGNAGRQFVAITDPGTTLVAYAREHEYRHTFLNPPDIGGRYSALSLFGLVPAALLDLNLEALVGAGQRMAERCRLDSSDNPGLALGAFLAEHAAAGRDKLTLLLPRELSPLGLWIEQLVAESTGKEGRGILPVVDEPIGSASDYGPDRAFVFLRTAQSRTLEPLVAALEAAGHPVFTMEAAPDGLGAEFFRWEFATAVAGAAIGINPFDEPNVREAKTRTQALLDAFRSTGALRVDPPLKPVSGVNGCLIREHRRERATTTPRGGYVAMLDYLPSDPSRAERLRPLRQRIRSHTGMPTTYGIGPRYLHSTGQYHKGGRNTGLFVLLTAPDETITAVPGTDYSFSVLKQAQALGDFDALVAAGRDVVHFHFDNRNADVSGAIEQVLGW